VSAVPQPIRNKEVRARTRRRRDMLVSLVVIV